MWTLISEPIEKEYRAPIISRSFLLSAGCCAFSFVVPILILLSIGYSWNTYTPQFVQPTLSYQNHQIACLLADNSATYDSTFTNEYLGNSYAAFVSVGGDQGNYIVTANILKNNVVACSMLIYFQVSLGSTFISLAVLPLNFYKSSLSSNLVSWTQSGAIYVRLLSAIPQSSIINPNFGQYFSNKTQFLNMNDVHLAYNSQKNVTLIPKITSSQPIYSSTANSFNYLGVFTVPSQQYISEVSLLQNIRTFVPYFIYLFILFWVFLAQPTVRWMVENKVYRAKVSHAKIKVN